MLENVGVYPSLNICERIESQYMKLASQKYNYLTARTMTNLYKLAMTVPREDVIWDAMTDVSKAVKDQIYTDIDSAKADQEKQKIKKDNAIEQTRKVVNLISSSTMENDMKVNVEMRLVAKASSDDATADDIIKELKQFIKDCEAGEYDEAGQQIVEEMKKS